MIRFLTRSIKRLQDANSVVEMSVTQICDLLSIAPCGRLLWRDLDGHNAPCYDQFPQIETPLSLIVFIYQLIAGRFPGPHSPIQFQDICVACRS